LDFDPLELLLTDPVDPMEVERQVDGRLASATVQVAGDCLGEDHLRPWGRQHLGPRWQDRQLRSHLAKEGETALERADTGLETWDLREVRDTHFLPEDLDLELADRIDQRVERIDDDRVE